MVVAATESLNSKVVLPELSISKAIKAVCSTTFEKNGSSFKPED